MNTMPRHLLRQAPLWLVVRWYALAYIVLYDLRMIRDVPYVPGAAGVTYPSCDCGECD